ncbi:MULTISPECIES: Tfp pilus assembly protein FimT/FimU [Pseudomonas]|uniref:Prepilin-type N-terminal cleavage/methylation domain-containing protein n=2 Tax=Pseudomonas TaxID=286 RepID=A0A1H2V1P3_9PSED|nr:prepilin-type N-terminal cleavage/methylation domain-containing protein [Pseudomonas kuykendallii]SDW62282.1 prepilin-type N-terminal cleavage/methylation domain-containing protein [Pseudomonas kuykendallii]
MAMRQDAGGFTLVEVMISLAVMLILLMAAIPMTISWSNSAKQRDAAGLLQQGLSRAKALALRNPGAVGAGMPSAALCLSGGTLSVLRLARDVTFSCTPEADEDVQWSAVIPSAASITIGGEDFQCLALDNRGLPVTVSGCVETSTGTFNVIVGSEDSLDVTLI